MKIKLPSIADQQRFIFERDTEESIKRLQASLAVPDKKGVKITDTKHLLLNKTDWQAPSPEVVTTYFENFKLECPEYGTDAKLAKLLGLNGDRAIRAYKEGSRTISYGLWRRFLIMTGRSPQEIIPVVGLFKDN